ncbi:MAG: VOC family protein [Aeromonas sp.]
MAGAARAGALIYVSDLARQIRFYQTLLGMQVLHHADDYAVLENADAQLVLHSIPAPYADKVVVHNPPQIRETSAIKLFFSVSSLAQAEVKAADLGGGLLPAQWSGPGFVMRNGFDPEGNVLQLREWLAESTE